MIRTLTLLAASILLLAACDTTETDTPSEADFTVRIENVSSEDTLPVPQAVPLSPGAWVVHQEPGALFFDGEAASAGLEDVAEDGDPSVLGGELPAETSGVFNTPTGADAPAPIGPAGTYQFSFDAAPGDALSFTTMFIQSNDWFYAPAPEGIPLFDAEGTPISGNISDQVNLYDAGTEADETPGLGVNQAPRQAGADTGDADPDTAIRGVPESDLSDLEGQVLGSSITATPGANGMTTFTVTLTNLSTPTSLTPTVAVPLSPGAWFVAEDAEPLFTVGEPDTGEGLEAIAEDGDPSILAASLDAKEGTSGVFNTPVGADAPGPIAPGGAYEFTFSASEGDTLQLATMFIQSNDWIYAPENGIELFEDGEAISGDVSVGLYDVGTEADETPGIGANQAPRQAGPNTGDADPDTTVRAVEDLMQNGSVIRVTVSSN